MLGAGRRSPYIVSGVMGNRSLSVAALMRARIPVTVSYMAAGVYISIPFCRQKCTYCNFASEARSFSALPEYLTALNAEIDGSGQAWQGAGLPRYDGTAVDSIYLGGGTPGLLTGEQLRSLRDVVSRRFTLSDKTEFTIEASPENATASRAAEWAAAGVNRVSMGVQSMAERELRAVGRQHTAAIVAEACANLRVAGIHNIGIDLIAGLPHQTVESWDDSMSSVIALDVPHVSVYMLEVDEDSRLGGELLREGARYSASAVPPDDQIVSFYGTAMARLRTAGYQHYEISNFAHAGFASRHNEKYWTAIPYFGFGVDAHSYDGAHRWANTDSIDDYLRCAAHGSVLSNPPEMLTDQQKREEMMFLGLRRREGLDMDQVKHAGMEARAFGFIERGWLERAGKMIRLTDDGVLFSNEVFAGFLGRE
jgi:oxygen-independent coproporphyrinogen III oxidase